MITKDIIREIKNKPNGAKLFKEVFNKKYNEVGYPIGDQFNEIVLSAILQVCPHLMLILKKLNNNTANSVAEKLDR